MKPGITTLNGYSQDFVAQDKCKSVALDQIGQGSDVVFQVAGGCGLGAISAAADSKAWGIGVDNDQSFLGSQVLTSATKKVDAGVTQTIKLMKDGKFKGGVDGVFNVKNGGVGYGKVSTKAPNRAALIAKLNTWAKQISTGKVKIPTHRQVALGSIRTMNGPERAGRRPTLSSSPRAAIGCARPRATWSNRILPR